MSKEIGISVFVLLLALTACGPDPRNTPCTGCAFVRMGSTSGTGDINYLMMDSLTGCLWIREAWLTFGGTSIRDTQFKMPDGRPVCPREPEYEDIVERLRAAQ